MGGMACSTGRQQCWAHKQESCLSLDATLTREGRQPVRVLLWLTLSAVTAARALSQEVAGPVRVLWLTDSRDGRQNQHAHMCTHSQEPGGCLVLAAWDGSQEAC
jgi:hypothetical protein